MSRNEVRSLPSGAEAADPGGREPPVVVVGAGPAGLTAAYQLVKAGRHPVVVEADDGVGGISRTVERDGGRVDIGGQGSPRGLSHPQPRDFFGDLVDQETMGAHPPFGAGAAIGLGQTEDQDGGAAAADAWRRPAPL